MHKISPQPPISSASTQQSTYANLTNFARAFLEPIVNSSTPPSAIDRVAANAAAGAQFDSGRATVNNAGVGDPVLHNAHDDNSNNIDEDDDKTVAATRGTASDSDIDDDDSVIALPPPPDPRDPIATIKYLLQQGDMPNAQDIFNKACNNKNCDKAQLYVTMITGLFAKGFAAAALIIYKCAPKTSRPGLTPLMSDELLKLPVDQKNIVQGFLDFHKAPVSDRELAVKMGALREKFAATTHDSAAAASAVEEKTDKIAPPTSSEAQTKPAANGAPASEPARAPNPKTRAQQQRRLKEEEQLLQQAQQARKQEARDSLQAKKDTALKNFLELYPVFEELETGLLQVIETREGTQKKTMRLEAASDTDKESEISLLAVLRLLKDFLKECQELGLITKKTPMTIGNITIDLNSLTKRFDSIMQLQQWASYVGEWKNNQPHGQGECDVGPYIYKGTWNTGTPKGMGTYQLRDRGPDGKTTDFISYSYHGPCDGMPCGKGGTLTKYDPNGVVPPQVFPDCTAANGQIRTPGGATLIFRK